MNRTGHGSQIPNDYFTKPPPLYNYPTCPIPPTQSSQLHLTNHHHNHSNIHHPPLHRFNSIQSTHPYFGSLRIPSQHHRDRHHHHNSKNRRLSSSIRDDQKDDNPLSVTSSIDDSSINRLKSINQHHQTLTNRFHSRMIDSMFETKIRIPSSSIDVGLTDRSNYYQTNPESETRLSLEEFVQRVRSIGSLGLIAEYEHLFKDQLMLDSIKCVQFG